ncbi:hypothetical protein [Streptomyces sp. NPDC048340]|uniref:hypothetical protein n=1 Tax=Streptomyces sp. NPDC048340 TaxID=3365537 RepID=UPI003714E9EF
MHHPVSIHIGHQAAGPPPHPRTDPVHHLLWARGFTYCSRLHGHTAPHTLPTEQQEHLVHEAVHALHSLGHAVAHVHHPRPKTDG